MKSILITGSGGFIGKNLKEYFKSKYKLLTPRSCELDLCNKNAVSNFFANHNIDLIIHCASIGGIRDVKDKTTTLQDNLAMVNNLLEYKSPKTRVILFGSGAMYGKFRNLCKVKETEIGNFVPLDLYGQSKVEIFKIAKKRDDVLCLNIFGCYGYGEKDSRFPSYAIDCVLNGKPIEINQNVVFDYLFIEDLEKIIEYFIENKPKDKIINITPTQSISLKEIAQIINTFTNSPAEIIIKNPILNNEYTGDNTLLKENYKNIIFTDYIKGLKKLYDYKYKKSRNNSAEIFLNK